MTLAPEAWRRILLDRRTGLLRTRPSIEALDDGDIVRLQEIADALMRLDAGRFGHCVECDEPISARRLAVHPTVALCIRCACARDLQRHAV